MIDNPIDIGDDVYIGGLYGDQFYGINNRIGKVDKIMYRNINNFYSTYIVDVLIDEIPIPININFLYKVSDFDKINGIKYKYHFSNTPENPLPFYYKNYNVIDQELTLDDMGRAMIFCKTRENKTIVLNITNFN